MKSKIDARTTPTRSFAPHFLRAGENLPIKRGTSRYTDFLKQLHSSSLAESWSASEESNDAKSSSQKRNTVAALALGDGDATPTAT